MQRTDVAGSLARFACPEDSNRRAGQLQQVQPGVDSAHGVGVLIDLTSTGIRVEDTSQVSVFALHQFIRKLDDYEPDIVRDIQALVATRGITPTERAVDRAIGSLEAANHKYVDRIQLVLARQDLRLAAGYGPIPSHIERCLRKCCGIEVARRWAKRIDPAVRSCLCVQHDDYGHEIIRTPVLDTFLQGARDPFILRYVIVCAGILSFIDVGFTVAVTVTRRFYHPVLVPLLWLMTILSFVLDLFFSCTACSRLVDAELDLDGRVQVEDIQVAHYWALGKWLTFQLRDATSILCWYYAKPHLNTTFRMHSDTVLAAVCPNCTSHTLTRTCSIAIVQVICYACYVLPAAKSWKAYWTQVFLRRVAFVLLLCWLGIASAWVAGRESQPNDVLGGFVSSMYGIGLTISIILSVRIL